MPFSPLVSKIRVHNPNKKGASKANRNSVIYIATREGVSLEHISDVNDLLKIKGSEKFEIKDELVHQEADNEQYLRYMAKRPRSHGLFGNINTDDLKEVSSHVAKITSQGKVIYRGVISLSENDGAVLGFDNINSWNNYLKEVMPEIAKELGVSTINHTWVAAFHAEEKHPHVHYMLWDNRDQIRSPYIHVATQQKIRIRLEEKMFDNEYQKMIKLIYKEELDLLNQGRADERAYMLESTADIMKDIEYVPGTIYERIPQRVPTMYLKELAEEVQKLIPMLPEKGNLKYKYMPQDAKEQLQLITNKLLERPDMHSSFNEYMQKVEQTHQRYGESRAKIQAEMEKAERDIRTRIKNCILSQVKENYIYDAEKESVGIEVEKTILPVKEIDRQEDNQNRAPQIVKGQVSNPDKEKSVQRNPVPFMERNLEQKPVRVMKKQTKEEEINKAINHMEQSEEQEKKYDKGALEQPEVGIDFAYCLFKGVLSSVETFNRQQIYDQMLVRTQSRQALKEEYLHSDMKKEHEAE